MDRTEFKITITPDGPTFYRHKIEIPSDVLRVEFEYEYYPERGKGGKNEIDFALTGKSESLMDAERDIGTRGSAVRKIVVSEAYSTAGFDRVAPSEIAAAVIGRGRLYSDAVEVTVRWKFIKKQRRYYAGDPHVHSINSDGRLTYERLLKKAKRKGLEFICVTDHNRTVIGELPAVEGLTAIEGVEVTLYNGHANFLGVARPYDESFSVENVADWRRLAAQARERGAVIVLNHPFCKRCPWRWELSAEDFDGVEVLNGPPREDNLNSAEWWKKQLPVKRLTPLGGSDYHRDYFVVSTLGMPTTFVLANSSEKKDILEGIKEGRTAVASSKKRGAIEMRVGNYTVGDEVPFSGNDTDTVTVRVPYIKKGEILRITDGKGVLKVVVASRTGELVTEVAPRGKGALYAEVMSRYRGIKRVLFDILLTFMLPEDAFKRHPDFIFALTAPIYFV